MPSPPKVVECVLAGDDEVLAGAADDQVDGRLPPGITLLPSPPWILSSPPLSVRISSPAPPRQHVVAVAALDAVVATVAIDRVVAVPQIMMSLPAVPPRTHWSVTGVLEIVGVGAGSVGVVADDQRMTMAPI